MVGHNICTENLNKRKDLLILFHRHYHKDPNNQQMKRFRLLNEGQAMCVSTSYHDAKKYLQKILITPWLLKHYYQKKKEKIGSTYLIKMNGM